MDQAHPIDAFEKWYSPSGVNHGRGGAEMLRPRMTAFVLAFCVFTAATAMAQYGQFEGTVRDSSGAVLPGATVTVTNQETGLTRAAVTSGDGFYRLPGLSPGVYSVRCELSNFATRTLIDIILTIQQTIIQNFTMDVAQIEETVTVTGESPLENSVASIKPVESWCQPSSATRLGSWSGKLATGPVTLARMRSMRGAMYSTVTTLTASIAA